MTIILHHEINIYNCDPSERQDAVNAYADKYEVDAAGVMSNDYSVRCALYEWQFKTNKQRYERSLRKKERLANDA